jgi:Secretion system C-terminal sorting domain
MHDKRADYNQYNRNFFVNSLQIKEEMKRITSFILLVFCLTSCFGQITISNNYFPNSGDSLVTANATGQTVRNILISTATTTAQNWDYSFLRAITPTNRNVDRFRALNPVTDSAILKEFPTATTVISDTTGQIVVYRSSATRFDLLGFFNANLGILPIGIRPKFDPPSLQRRAPLTFNSTNNNKTGFNVAFSTDIIPDTILALLPVRPDSMRIRFVTNRQDKVDAFGKIRIPGSAAIDCLRERRYEITETRIDAKSNSFPIWIDITTLIPTGNFRTKDTTLVFHFWSDLYKEPLLTIRANNDSTATSATYKWLQINTPTSDPLSKTTAVLYPNPTKNAINAHFEGLNEGNYLLTVVDNLGRIVFNQNIKNMSSTVSLRIETNRWAAGLYFLNLYSETGKGIVLRKTFMVGE